ncbi:outer membrane beta-barrel protein [Aquimarina algicola]|uniref:Uncharacterized protein n=1 Tax=Aquimarina algicola TaxID=2589995 RepID=A0A504JAW0_9FLAO|nr:outer membrane beta-barrel protein [Aquimarina algicola]TPN83401.1 hypothetical protein FHK87_19460 [Aquimarina algicola]
MTTLLPNTFVTTITTTIFILLFSSQVKSQPKTGQFINASIGLGINATTDESDLNGNGFYLQGEYVLALSKWFGIRPYAGLILASSDDDDNSFQNQRGYKIRSNAFLLGAKTRILAPIPWVAPYFEIGVGLSAGTFKTFTPFTDKEDSGVLVHIPFTLGLMIGRENNFDFAFSYYFHPTVEQFSGAVAIGYSFPLN